jgi:ADP-ribose pyrophosphatase YjhB (NUDIX family)
METLNVQEASSSMRNIYSVNNLLYSEDNKINNSLSSEDNEINNSLSSEDNKINNSLSSEDNEINNSLSSEDNEINKLLSKSEDNIDNEDILNPDLINIDNKEFLENDRMMHIIKNTSDDFKFKKRMSRCNNCGNCGHYYNRCMDPITSIGVLAFKIDGFNNLNVIFKDLIVHNKHTMMKIKQMKGIDLDHCMVSENSKKMIRVYASPPSPPLTQKSSHLTQKSSHLTQKSSHLTQKSSHLTQKSSPFITQRFSRSPTNVVNEETCSKLKLFNKYLSSIKFLMVRRKFTLGFIEFMKAKWDARNIDQLIKIFNGMRKKELDFIMQNIESDGWKNIFDHFWIKDGKINFEKKKEDFGRKFIELRNISEWNIEYYCINIAQGNGTPDWGFCKGRREDSETNYETAIRETKEESGNDVLLLENLQELREDIIKDDGGRLRNIYYLGLLNDDAKAEYRPDLYIAHQSEIGKIGFFNYMDAISLISNEHVEKKNVLTQAYMFIASRLMKYDAIQTFKNNLNKKVLEESVTIKHALDSESDTTCLNKTSDVSSDVNLLVQDISLNKEPDTSPKTNLLVQDISLNKEPDISPKTNLLVQDTTSVSKEPDTPIKTNLLVKDTASVSKEPEPVNRVRGRVRILLRNNLKHEDFIRESINNSLKSHFKNINIIPHSPLKNYSNDDIIEDELPMSKSALNNESCTNKLGLNNESCTNKLGLNNESYTTEHEHSIQEESINS